MGGESREEYERRVHIESIDHLVSVMMLNADGEHAGKLFLQAHENNLFVRQPGIDPREMFLDRVLPRLASLERLPARLVPFMVKKFEWPQTVAEIDWSQDLRPDVRALLKRHASENWLVRDGQKLADREVDRQLFMRRLLAVIGGVLLLSAVIAWKIMLRVLN